MRPEAEGRLAFARLRRAVRHAEEPAGEPVARARRRRERAVGRGDGLRDGGRAAVEPRTQRVERRTRLPRVQRERRRRRRRPRLLHPDFEDDVREVGVRQVRRRIPGEPPRRERALRRVEVERERAGRDGHAVEGERPHKDVRAARQVLQVDVREIRRVAEESARGVGEVDADRAVPRIY